MRSKAFLHHMIDIVAPSEDYSAASYQKAAFELIEKENGKGRIPVIAGGTGLYIHSLVYDIDFTKTAGGTTEFDKNTHNGLMTKSLDALYNELKEKDPTYARIIASSDKRRIIRRLEVLEEGGGQAYDFRRVNQNDDFPYHRPFGCRASCSMSGLTHALIKCWQMALLKRAYVLYNKYGLTNALKAIVLQRAGRVFLGQDHSG